LEEIAAFPLVLLRSGFCTRELIEEGLNQTDIRANILAEFDSIDAIVSCVEEVPAISILPEHACHWRAYPGIKIIPLRGDRWKRSVGLITPRIAAPLPAVSCFVDFLHVNSPEARSRMTNDRWQIRSAHRGPDVRAVARPMPVVPPVMRMFLFFMREGQLI